MKIKFSFHCNKCFEVTDQSEQAYKKMPNYEFQFEVNDENLYEGICEHGHPMFFSVQEEKFEILFDFAAIALLDGYTKEAVSTLASSFERFVEFFIKVTCAHNSIGEEEFLKTWNKMKNQSERQLGAFYILQLIEFGSTKYLLDENMVKFRNKVIHQGYIPSTEDTIKYGNYVLSTIFKILKELKIKHSASIFKAIIWDVKEKKKNTKDNQFITLSKPTIINLSAYEDLNFGVVTFEEALNNLRNSGWHEHIYIKGS